MLGLHILGRSCLLILFPSCGRWRCCNPLKFIQGKRSKIWAPCPTDDLFFPCARSTKGLAGLFGPKGSNKNTDFPVLSPPNSFVGGGSIWNHDLSPFISTWNQAIWIRFEWILPPIFPGKTMFGHQNWHVTQILPSNWNILGGNSHQIRAELVYYQIYRIHDNSLYIVFRLPSL